MVVARDMLRALCAIALLGGCDFVWRIDHFDHAPADAVTSDSDLTIDGPMVDAACSPTEHDEDSDSIPDRCDNCPTVMNTNQRDTDNDGVGNACDPDIVALKDDHIALFSPFVDLSQFTQLGSPSVDTSDHAILHLGDELTSIASAVKPTLAIVEFQISSPSSSAEPRITLGAANCSVSNKVCPTSMGTVCLKSNGTFTALNISFGSITSLELRGDASGFTCIVVTASMKYPGPQIATQLVDAPIDLTIVGGAMTWTVANVIVYGH